MTVVTRFAPSPTGYPAYRRRAHRALQLAVRPPPWRQVPAAHRGHRPRPLHPAGRRRDPRRTVMARPAIGTATSPTSSSARRVMPRSREQMLAEGKAYHCYASPQELEEMRAAQKAAGMPMRYDGRWRDRDPKEAPPGVAPVDPAARRRRAARRSSRTPCRARSRSRTPSSTT